MKRDPPMQATAISRNYMTCPFSVMLRGSLKVDILEFETHVRRRLMQSKETV